MSTEPIGAYSPDTVYGQLTMPFVFDKQRVVINAHTPYDKVEAGAQSFSKDNFVATNNPNFRYSVEEIREMKMAESLSSNIIPSEEDEAEVEFPPKNVAEFTASSLSKTDIVKNALKNNSPRDAITIGNAAEAYSKSILSGNNPIKSLGDRSFYAHN